MDNSEILAVHKQKLEEFLRKLELWEPLVKGELKCHECGATISLDNLGLIIPADQEIQICCTKTDCVFRMKQVKSELTNETRT
jgi:hypothetical protein